MHGPQKSPYTILMFGPVLAGHLFITATVGCTRVTTNEHFLLHVRATNNIQFYSQWLIIYVRTLLQLLQRVSETSGSIDL